MNFLYDWVVNTFPGQVFWTYYVLNLIFAAIAYKLGFARELPWQKSIIVYLLLAVGNFILAVFSIMKLPITESLIIISLILGMYRYRLHKERSAKGNEA
ncbi:YlaH-like family protein [Aciduricibacillus chroicocephali]|uniref:YlaH-like family protein n=1 Tax=Aciduricibacillus chroicocephali TaxID=3054939 RepID=A0ABY9KXS8_9BACI|nr:YlaH-like family protein [Bacillaceae bacterium 44XB]